MAFNDYLQFENPGAVIIAIGVLVFLVVFTAFRKSFKRMNKGIVLLISILIAVMSSWYIYKIGLDRLDSAGTVGVVVGFLIFMIVYFFIRKAKMHRGFSLVLSAGIAAVVGWIIYGSFLKDVQNTFAIMILALVLIVVIALFLPFGRHLRSNF